MTEIDDDTAVPEFPVLSEDEVRDITWGVYQVAQAKNYCNTHMDEDGNYEVSYHCYFWFCVERAMTYW